MELSHTEETILLVRTFCNAGKPNSLRGAGRVAFAHAALKRCRVPSALET